MTPQEWISLGLLFCTVLGLLFASWRNIKSGMKEEFKNINERLDKSHEQLDTTKNKIEEKVDRIRWELNEKVDNVRIILERQLDDHESAGIGRHIDLVQRVSGVEAKIENGSSGHKRKSRVA